jgi:hypothetical protein
MAMKPTQVDQRRRQLRQQSYIDAPQVSTKWPNVGEIRVALTYADPEGQVPVSAYRQIFVPDMQAFFDFLCPARECVGGGFDIGDAVEKLVKTSGHEVTGTLCCGGKRTRPGVSGTSPCGLKLSYHVAVRSQKSMANDAGPPDPPVPTAVLIRYHKRVAARAG